MKCLQCEKPTRQWGKSYLKYCSRDCGRAYYSGLIKKNFGSKNCLVCNIVFLPKSEKHKCCSRKCKGRLEGQARSKKPKTKECKVCQKTFIPYTSLDKFCSIHCRVENMKSGRSRRWNDGSVKKRYGKDNPGYVHGGAVRGVKIKSDGMRAYQKSARAYRERMMTEHGYLFCERCGATNVRFETHHIIYRSEKPGHPSLHDHRNLIRVCVPCHNHYHKSRLNRSELVQDRHLVDVFGLSILK